MKVKSLKIEYFKRFRQRPISFTDPETGLAKDLVVLLGNNGTGKSTVLQAIAATLGTAVRRLERPGDLKWPGFELQLVGSAWQLPAKVDVEVEFSDAELQATQEFFAKVPQLRERSDAVAPAGEPLVVVTLSEGAVRAGSRAEYFQFRGREYAKQIVKLVPEGREVFRKVGTVFWYTEHRTATSLTAEQENGREVHYDENLLRRRLADLMQFHQRVKRGEYTLRPGQRDLFEDIERAYRTVFPTRRFEGPVPRSDIDQVMEEPWFYLYDGSRQYEVSEMSGGERAIFPILFDFANWNIHNSIVLIDELELHLHPPMQQGLLRALRSLGENNQFILTTHSDAIEDVVPPSAICRLEE
ncbi:MAG: ATP-binding protein [Planctomycetota bacterium]